MLRSIVMLIPIAVMAVIVFFVFTESMPEGGIHSWDDFLQVAFFPLAIVAMGLVMLLIRYWMRRRRETEAVAAPIQEAISSREASGGKCGCWAGAWMFFLAGLGFSLVFIIPGVKNLQARSWAETDCEILRSWVQSHSGDDGGTTYSVEVEYRYTFDGVEYQGDRYQFMGGSSSGHKGKRKVVDALPEGSTTTCWVDPEEPSESVLYRGWSWVYLIVLFPMVFVVAGAVGLWITWKSGPDTRTVSLGGESGESKNGLEAVFAADTDGLPEVPAGPMELEESVSPLGKLAMLLFFTVFWNGIVGVFLFAGWHEWQQGGSFPGCMALFLLPFVIIGVLLLVSVPYQILALANPRPQLRLAEGGVRVGESTSLEWSFRGAAHRIRDFRLVLEGKESATYTMGTNRSTATRVFERLEVASIDRGMLAHQGSARIEVPQGTMHSFDFGDNEISWKLKLHAKIRWWPDVITEFPFVVRPPERGYRG